MDKFMMGAIAMACWAVGLFFFRFWRETHDRLFAIFGAAFWLLGFSRLGLASSGQLLESNTLYYVVRLIAFLLILFAILDKNRFWLTRSNTAVVDESGGKGPNASGSP